MYYFEIYYVCCDVGGRCGNAGGFCRVVVAWKQRK